MTTVSYTLTTSPWVRLDRLFHYILHIFTHLLFTMGSKCLVIGISGATCSGKTTLAHALHKIIKKSVAINQDQFYWDEESENHILAEGVKHINWELVTAFNNDKLLKEIKSYSNCNSDHEPSTMTDIDLDSVFAEFNKITEDIRGSPEKFPFFQDIYGSDELVKQLQTIFGFFSKVVILDGILIFNHPELLNVCDLKFFMTLDYKTCSERRTTRSYDPPDVPGYFEKIVYPYYVRNLADMKILDSNGDIIYLDGANDILENFKVIVTKSTELFKSLCAT